MVLIKGLMKEICSGMSLSSRRYGFPRKKGLQQHRIMIGAVRFPKTRKFCYYEPLTKVAIYPENSKNTKTAVDYLKTSFEISGKKKTAMVY